MVHSVAFWRDTEVAAGLNDGTAQVWDLPDGRELATLSPNSGVINAVLFADMSTLAVCTSGKKNIEEMCGELFLCNIRSASCVRAYALHDHGLSSLAVVTGPKCLLIGCTDGRIAVLRMDDKRVIRRFKAHEGNVRALAVSPDEQLLATGGEDHRQPGVIKLWDLGCIIPKSQ
jgi:WD40 repeat protein